MIKAIHLPNGKSISINNYLNIQISKNFTSAEVLPPEFFLLPPVELNQKISIFLRLVPQLLRDNFGKDVIINNWISGGQYFYSGARPLDCIDGAPLSYHKKEMAIDVKIPGYSPAEILDHIKKNEKKYFPLITSYEPLRLTPSWLHLDCRFTGLSQITEIRM